MSDRDITVRVTEDGHALTEDVLPLLNQFGTRKALLTWIQDDSHNLCEDCRLGIFQRLHDPIPSADYN